MTALFNTDEIRRRTVEGREAVGELTKAQKLADAMHCNVVGSSHGENALRMAYEAMHDPLPKPNAGEREEGPKLPPVGTVVVSGATHGFAWRAASASMETRCITNSSGVFYVAPGTWRYATDAEIDAFLAELPR